MEEIRLTALEKFLGAENTEELRKRLMNVIVDDFKENLKNFSEFDYAQVSDIAFEALDEAKEEIKNRIKEHFLMFVEKSQ